MTEARKLIDALFEPGDIVEIRSVRPGHAGKVHDWYVVGDSGWDAIEARLRDANATDHAFFGANPRSRAGGTKANDVPFARSFFADFDRSASGEKTCSVSEALDRLRDAMLPSPTAVVSTGAGCHVYWRLDDPIEDLDVWSRTQKAIIKTLRTDPAIHDAPRCMRLPGFANVKYAHRPVAQLVRADGRICYPEYEFPEPLPPRSVPTAAELAGVPTGSMSVLSRRFIEEGFTLPDGRRATVFAVACDLAARQWKLEDAVAAIMRQASRFDMDASEIDDIPRQVANAFAVPRSPILDDPIRLVEKAEEKRPKRTLTLRDAIRQWRERKDPRGISIGGMFQNLMPEGLPVGQIICVAAPPGIGKTALALQMVALALVDDAELTAVWGMGEMTADRLAERIIAAQGGVPMDDVRTRSRAALEESDRVAELIGDRLTLLPDPLYVDEIAETVQEAKAKLLVVDYLQLVRGRQRGSERRQEVDQCLRDLRTLANRGEVALVLISNLAKGVTHLKRPDSIDVGKESSEIAYQVDLMLYGSRLEDGFGSGENAIEWQCLKNRHGPEENTTVRFVPELQVFQYRPEG